MRDSGSARQAGPSRLAEALAARDRRARRQAELASAHGLPVLSLTLVSPGPRKAGPEFDAFLSLAAAALEKALSRVGLVMAHAELFSGPSGPELLAVLVSAAAPLAASSESLTLLARDAKKAAVSVEDGAYWGRLIDADILQPAGPGEVPRALRREELGFTPRSCLLCGASAMECMSARRHAPEELAAAAERLRLGIPGSESTEARVSFVHYGTEGYAGSRAANHPWLSPPSGQRHISQGGIE